MIDFPKGFFWGTATSAYQIEGFVHEDGRVPSNWDTFCHSPGCIFHQQNADHACQHYINWKQDIQLMKAIGVNAYRFSIAWPRIYSSDTTINHKGLDFYSRLIDELLNQGIEPFVTMFHWDLPQFIQDRGGWSLRETSFLFRDYAHTLLKHFSDRVRFWTTINEPSVVVYAGHFFGVHAPGIRNPEIAMKALHHLLLGHGLAIEAIRESFNVQIGIALNLSPVYPYNTQSEWDQKSALLYDTYLYTAFLEALFQQKYPTTIPMGSWVEAKDMELIALPLDYLGINYYTATRVSYDSKIPYLLGKANPAKPNPYSDFWEFYPQGLTEVIQKIRQYTQKPLYILENGTSLPDEITDSGRINYLKAHLDEVKKNLSNGVDLRGYFVWSLMDNFEWAEGYSKRFGLYYNDFETQQRKPKESARWYSDWILKNS